MRVAMNVLLGISLAISLMGCSERVIIKEVYIKPPLSLLQPTYYLSARAMGVTTYGQLVSVYVPYLKTRIGACSLDKLSVIEYLENVEEKAP